MTRIHREYCIDRKKRVRWRLAGAEGEKETEKRGSKSIHVGLEDCCPGSTSRWGRKTVGEAYVWRYIIGEGGSSEDEAERTSDMTIARLRTLRDWEAPLVVVLRSWKRSADGTTGSGTSSSDVTLANSEGDAPRPAISPTRPATTHTPVQLMHAS